MNWKKSDLFTYMPEPGTTVKNTQTGELGKVLEVKETAVEVIEIIVEFPDESPQKISVGSPTYVYEERGHA